MPFTEQSQFVVNFTGGLNTEATSINFPENAAQALDNFDLFITGEIKRRLGLDFEDSYTVRPETTSAANIANYAVGTSEWKAVNGQGDLNFLVVQIGLILYFHDLGVEPMSSTLRGSIDLSASKTGESPENKILSFAFGEGVLVVGNSDLNPTIIEYDSDLNTFSATSVVIEVRDFTRVPEPGVPIDHRDSGLTRDHNYNLRNQGWPRKTRCATDPKGDDGILYTDPVPHTWRYLAESIYPSNADIFHACKAVAADEARAIGTYSPWVLLQIATGNTPAPAGHYILEAFNENRRAASGIEVSTNGDAVTNRRPSALAFYAGRVWYAGVPDKNYIGNIYFSQTLTDPKHAGKCYQDYDPTAEDLNAILATDGGVLRIADMGQVHKLVPVGQDLVVVATNGVWAISGEAARGNFQADKLSIRKITEQGSIARESVVVSEGQVHWWGEGAIWRMQGSQIDESLVVDPITRGTIQSFYDDEISVPSKAYARGFYDIFDKKVYWLYNDTDTYDAINFRFQYNRMLVLDMSLNAFYTYTISDLDTNTPWVAGMTQKSPGSETVTTYDIFVGEDDVVEAADDIVQDVAFESFADVQLKLLSFVQNEDTTYSYTFSEFKDRDFHDWKAWDVQVNHVDNVGADYSSFIQTGWTTGQDIIRDKSITHITSYFNRTEDGYAPGTGNGVVIFTNPSSAIAQVRWEYTDQDVGRWTAEREAYKLRYFYIPEDEFDPFTFGYTTIRSQLRMRGKGSAFSVRYRSSEGKDLQLLGYGVNMRAGKTP